VAVTASQGAGTTSDYLKILSGTSQNVAGIAVAALANIVVQVVFSRTLGPAGFGVVTLLTQAAFVASFATRSGMDMAVLRDVAVEVGQGRFSRIRSPVARAVGIAAAVSVVAAVAVSALSEPIRSLLSIDPQLGHWVVPAAAIGLPFLALANVWLSATRGLKIMRYTLYVFWAGQPIVWILVTLAGWAFSTTPWMAVLGYSLSWGWAAAMAAYFWRKESRGWAISATEPQWLSRLVRYAGPRAPAALFSQLLFWADLFVLTRYASDTEVGVYSAALRAGQVVVLFLTSVNLMFSPYVADLYNRGEIDRLDHLFKTLTRWTIIATLPLFLVIAVTPDGVLHLFGEEFGSGQVALAVLLAGQFVNVATGSAGFILIMIGRTGWDLLVYAGSFALDLALAFWLAPRYGMTGAAAANAVTFTVSNLARLWLVRKALGAQPYDRDYLRIIGPAGLTAAAMWLVHTRLFGEWLIDLVAVATVGALVYVASFLAIGLNRAERRGVRALVARIRDR
jgi:O-antigen/teichoic acid export membrane protein